MGKFNLITTDSGTRCLTVYADGELFTTTSDQDNFETVLKAVVVEQDYSDVPALFNPARGMNKQLDKAQLSDDIYIDENRGVIFWKGERVAQNALVDFIWSLIGAQSEDYIAMANFLGRVLSNPEFHSRNRLFDWLQSTGGFQINHDGFIIGYKGIRSDLTSVTSGPGIVNDEHVEGHLDNSPGNHLQIEQLEFDPSIGCSVGLHFGTWSYASSFGSTVVSVLVDPADVGSVPTDCESQKARCFGYRVLEVRTEPYKNSVVNTEGM